MEDPPSPELCDVCGAVITDGSEVYGTVPDSSAIHASEPKFDGRRFVAACSTEHLDQLCAQYADRPFIAEEQWAGKVGRAIEADPGLSVPAIAETTGLTPSQVRDGIEWHKLRAAAINRRRDADGAAGA